MPKENFKNLGVYVAIFFITVAFLIYFYKPSKTPSEKLPKYLGRNSALKAYSSCKTGKKCKKIIVISNLSSVSNKSFWTTPYTTIYSCTGDRLTACEGGRADNDKLTKILDEINNSRCEKFIYDSTNDSVKNLKNNISIQENSSLEECDNYFSVVVEQYA